MTTSAHPTTSPAASAPDAPYRPTRRTVLGALWLFTILNYAYCDVLGTHDVDYLNGILTGDGTGGSVQLTPTMLLGASVLMTIPISAVLVTRVAGRALARWWSITAGVVMTLVQTASLFVGETTVYYAYFSAIEIPTTALIAVIAWRWTREA
ncbi:DUF6326 family protein [Nocardioides sp.]|uniref:DUF6326 family protein n=1 Tax=Nocardioides sp. TaxID=35761 RepID=UPI003526D9C6